jgi:hypothetical protein
MKFIEGMHVYNKEEVKTKTQVAQVTTYVGPAYKTVLTHDPVAGTIRAEYLDYEGNPVDFNGEVIFEFDGEQQAVQTINGVAEIPFIVVDSGTYVVRTANPDIENGEVTINA